jgi:cytoskeletal protein RodZ
MSDASVQEIIDNLRRSVRRWKTLSLTLLVALGFAIVVGSGTALAQVQRARAARQAELEARQQAEQQLDAALRNADRSNELANERLRLARQAVDELFTGAAEDGKTK